MLCLLSQLVCLFFTVIFKPTTRKVIAQLNSKSKQPSNFSVVKLSCSSHSIRRRALDLVVGMVNRKNLPEIVKKLVEQVDLSENMAFKEVRNCYIISCQSSLYFLPL